ncbi:SEC14-like protein 2 [Daphnia carinata]|uniref:SEC14-like protein 2 n=1 Tax=Daphnia carinata TaxID=120202 RepID=UPI00257A6921|nr:SEC14-like protein 2 [Daphnia carinata]
MTDLKLLNDEQKAKLNKFRNIVKELKLKDSSDEYLHKWLIVQDFNVARAEDMLRQSLEWRRVNGADDILDTYTPIEVLRNYFSLGQVGIDKFDCPVFACAFGRIDIKGLRLCLTNKEYNNFVTWLFETIALAIKKQIERTGKRTIQMIFIFDFEHFSMKQLASKLAVETILDIVKRLLANYPNIFRRVFIINAPRIFPMLFAMVKPLIPASDFPKIKIFSADKNEWLSALLEEIDADQFPSFYGGTLTDPDGNPKCPSKFNMGGEVPHIYYLSNNGPVAKDYMETLNVMAGVGGKKKLKFNADVPESIMRWQFMTEGGDTSFRIYSKDSKSNEDLVPLVRVDSHLAMEEGQVTCDQPGKYVFEFDNSFSYLRSKKVRYHITVHSPSEKV